MKKLMTMMAVLALAITSNAASINWTVSGLASKVVNDKAGSPAANETVYLILAGTSDLASITDCADAAKFNSALSAITLDSGTTTSEGKKPSISNKVVTNDALTANTTYTFGLLYVCEDAKGDGYYKVVTASAPAYTTGDTANAKTLSTSFANLESASWTKAYSAPAPIPEPATGALALAGVALLFRRRRA